MGIDVSSTELETHVLINSTKGLSSRFENSKKGCKKLLKYAAKHEVTTLVMEATGGYEQKIARAGMEVHLSVKIVNPAQVRHFAKGFGITAKTDKIDAYVIALFDEKVKPPETIAKSKEQLKLTELIRRRNALKKMIQEDKNRKHTSEDFTKRSILRVTNMLEKEVKFIDAELLKIKSNSLVISKKCDVLCQQKGVGITTALSLLALLPELGFLDRKQIASLAGLAPIARDSGKLKGKRFISGGRFEARGALYMSAWVATQFDAEFSAFYAKLQKRGKKPKVAIVAVMRRMLVKLNGKLKDYLNEVQLEAS